MTRGMVLLVGLAALAVGCTPAERCAAARGASLACTFVNVAADEVCEGASMGGAATAGGEGPALSPDERAAALESLDAARAAVLAAPAAP